MFNPNNIPNCYKDAKMRTAKKVSQKQSLETKCTQLQSQSKSKLKFYALKKTYQKSHLIISFSFNLDSNNIFPTFKNAIKKLQKLKATEDDFKNYKLIKSWRQSTTSELILLNQEHLKLENAVNHAFVVNISRSIAN